ncbi:DUF4360 domain-containing protein [Spirillospora sp. CA-294931]|uniref:DUF4360 domain-containing protein n=1 Tax=Spirillospora sp. CA-294931 TaxID=3240042 RepID=UPI003D946684
MHKRTTITAAIALAFGALAAAPANAQTPPDGPDGITIEVATVNGSGCPKGTVAVAVSPDKEAFTVTYSDYLARVGGTSDPVDFRKNCQLNLKVHVPQGFTYAIASADYRGFAHLQTGATGVEKASYYFQGMSQTTSATHTLKGPHSNNWQFTDKTEVAQLVWKPCGEQRNFNVNTELRVNAGTSDPAKTSFMTMDSVDGSIKTTYHFAWKECPKP